MKRSRLGPAITLLLTVWAACMLALPSLWFMLWLRAFVGHTLRVVPHYQAAQFHVRTCWLLALHWFAVTCVLFTVMLVEVIDGVSFLLVAGVVTIVHAAAVLYFIRCAHIRYKQYE